MQDNEKINSVQLPIKRPAYPPSETFTPEEREAKLKQVLSSLTDRYGDRLIGELEGLGMRKEITYDDYLETQALLSLQSTQTDYHDELIFKVYHQQTELWFRLMLHEIQRAIRSLLLPESDLPLASESIRRTNRYFSILTTSFGVLLEGMSIDDFNEFRKAFGTSSGFQSSQFRAIEILLGLEREKHGHGHGHGQKNGEAEEPSFYWERAARDIETGEPTMTLLKFKEKHLQYLNELYLNRKPFSLRMAIEHIVSDISGDKENVTNAYTVAAQKNPDLKELIELTAGLEAAIIGWKKMHLKVAARHLARTSKGTGETNWAEYLAKSISDQRYFPGIADAVQKFA